MSSANGNTHHTFTYGSRRILHDTVLRVAGSDMFSNIWHRVLAVVWSCVLRFGRHDVFQNCTEHLRTVKYLTQKITIYALLANKCSLQHNISMKIKMRPSMILITWSKMLLISIRRYVSSKCLLVTYYEHLTSAAKTMYVPIYVIIYYERTSEGYAVLLIDQ